MITRRNLSKPEVQRRLLVVVITILLLLAAIGKVNIAIALLLLMLGLLGMKWRAQFTTCPCCNGDGRIHGRDAYVNATFTGQVCYFCKGEKFIRPTQNVWHSLRQQSSEQKWLLIQKQHTFRRNQARFRQENRPYLMHNDPPSDREHLDHLKRTETQRLEALERLIEHYFQLECIAHRILFQKYKEAVAQRWLQQLASDPLTEEFYRATEYEKEAQMLKKYDCEIQGLETITSELRELEVPQTLIVELEASTERLRQERDVA